MHLYEHLCLFLFFMDRKLIIDIYGLVLVNPGYMYRVYFYKPLVNPELSGNL